MNDTSKIHMIVLDGAGDRPIASLGGLTPYAYARTQNLDRIAADASQGLVTIIDPAIPPESDSGIMALLSYDPMVHYTGRGPLEGLGTGYVSRHDNSVSFRINLASYDQNRRTLDRRTSRGLDDSELQALGKELRDNLDFTRFGDIQFSLDVFRNHRGILSFKSGTLALSGNVSNTDPGFKKIGAFGVPNASFEPVPLDCYPLDASGPAHTTALLVNEFCRQAASILEGSPVNANRRCNGMLAANYVLVRDGGERPSSLTPFSERFGCTLSLYGQMPAERGLMMLMGGQFSYSIRPEVDFDAYYAGAADAVLKDPADVVVVHLKGPDEPGHDNDPAEKVAAIEEIDRYFFGRYLQRVPEDTFIVVTSDHATPCDLGIHAPDPVPTMVKGPGIDPDQTTKFSERAAESGDLAVDRAIDLLPFVLARRLGGRHVDDRAC